MDVRQKTSKFVKQTFEKSLTKKIEQRLDVVQEDVNMTKKEVDEFDVPLSDEE